MNQYKIGAFSSAEMNLIIKCALSLLFYLLIYGNLLIYCSHFAMILYNLKCQFFIHTVMWYGIGNTESGRP